jgi:uncharacterized protein YprB with RNaseH-like and TPR domain/rubredoxin
MESGYTLCWAAKWLGEEEMYSSSRQTNTEEDMLVGIHSLLNEADAVVHFNGKRFDIPTLNKDFLENNFAPPSPYKQIDLWQTVKTEFRFPSNKLEYVCKALGVGQKIKTIGHELWVRCMAGDPEAWAMMIEYNINDVLILEEVYWELLPWIKGHANHAIYQDNKLVCPNCGGTHYHARGFAYTHTNKYQRFQCQVCGKWFRDNKPMVIPGKKFVDIN